MEQIRAYAASRRMSDLVLAPCFKKPERSKLHTLAAGLKLEHTTVGVEADAQLVVHKWRPLRCFTAAVGKDAIGSTVAKDKAPPPPPAAPARRASRGASQRPAEPATPARPDASWAAGDLALVPKSTWPDYPCTEGDGWLVNVVTTKGAGASAQVVVHFVRARTRDDRPFEDVRLLASALRPPPEGAAAAAAAAGAAGAHEVVRGGVVGFDEHTMLWKLDYDDGTSESVGIDLLNVRLQRRHYVDAVADGDDDGGGLGMLPVPRVGGPTDGVELQKLLDGIHPEWARGRLKYDIRHFMANFSMMVAAQKDSPTYGKFMAYVSAAIFKILPGE